MTTTDVGILLVVLCVLLWAIMAALHRHTVQLKALQVQLDKLTHSDERHSSREGSVSIENPYVPPEPEHGPSHVAGAPRDR